jgi:hypothetical protein
MEKELETLEVMVGALRDYVKGGASPVVVVAYCRRLIEQVLRVWKLAETFPPRREGRP